MSTQYKLCERNGITVELDERSLKFELCLYQDVVEDSSDGSYLAGDQKALSDTDAVFLPEDLVTMSLAMLKVASYVLDDEEIREKITETISGDSWMKNLLISVGPLDSGL